MKNCPIKVTIAFGAAVPPLKNQLQTFEIDPKDRDHLQKDCDALARLHVRGILGDTAVRTARAKIFKKVMAAMKGEKAAT